VNDEAVIFGCGDRLACWTETKGLQDNWCTGLPSGISTLHYDAAAHRLFVTRWDNPQVLEVLLESGHARPGRRFATPAQGGQGVTIAGNALFIGGYYSGLHATRLPAPADVGPSGRKAGLVKTSPTGTHPLPWVSVIGAHRLAPAHGLSIGLGFDGRDSLFFSTRENGAGNYEGRRLWRLRFGTTISLEILAQMKEATALAIDRMRGVVYFPDSLNETPPTFLRAMSVDGVDLGIVADGLPACLGLAFDHARRCLWFVSAGSVKEPLLLRIETDTGRSTLVATGSPAPAAQGVAVLEADSSSLLLESPRLLGSLGLEPSSRD
jgi:hypothetical protein